MKTSDRERAMDTQVTASYYLTALKRHRYPGGQRVIKETPCGPCNKRRSSHGAAGGLFGSSVGLVLVLLSLAGSIPHPALASPWDTAHFPNVTLTTQKGEQVRFFDDLIKGKVVVINFIFTSCVDTCPLETAHLVQVARILGDRVGEDIFFYSITIDPEVDTPTVLHDYAQRYGADWTFLTGAEEDITLLRRRLGLYIEEIQDGSNNHNVSMIIGNEATGQWRKSSPFENAYVAAEKIGQWLTGWKAPAVGGEYGDAPQLRRLSRGEQLFRNRCSSCHTINGEAPGNTLLSRRVGPDLFGVTQLRERKWLIDWISAPDKMLEKGDPIALSLFRQYGELPMPNLRLNQVEVMDLIDFLDDRSSGSVNPSAEEGLEFTNARIRAPANDEPATAGYVTIDNTTMSAMTIQNLKSTDFERIEMHETVTSDHGARMQRIDALTIQPGESIEFSPGGKHLMMIGPKGVQKEGQKLRITVTFSSGRQREVMFDVVMNTLMQHHTGH